MVYLLSAIISNAIFGQSYKFSTVRGYDVDWVCVLSFVFGGFFLLLTPDSGRGAIAWPAVVLGVGFGLAGGLSQLTFFRALRHGALSVSYSVVALSILIPVLASILFWAERPTILQGAAIGGAVLAVALMGDVELRRVQQPLAWAGWLGLSYVASGLGSICMKVMVGLQTDRSLVTFLLVGYTVSALLGLPLVRGRWPGWREAAAGAVRGLAILSANWLLLKAMELLPGYLVFAAYGAGIVMVNVLAAVLVWGERPRGWAFVGILLAVAAIILFNL